MLHEPAAANGGRMTRRLAEREEKIPSTNAMQASGVDARAAVEELDQLLEDALHEFLEALDDWERGPPRDAIDACRWRWQLQANLLGILDAARDCLDMVTAEIERAGADVSGGSG